jgi:hypothetical protein
MATIVISRPPGFDPAKNYIFCASEDGGAEELKFQVMDVRKKKSKEEIRQKRREYRRKYTQKPEVKAKIQKRLADPLVIQKRKEYAQRPDVKVRKHVLAGRARAIRNRLKETHPELYQQMLKELDAQHV